MENLSGKWKMNDIMDSNTPTFYKILKKLKYSDLSIKYIQRKGLKVGINFENNKIHVKYSSPFYNYNKFYHLDNKPREINDKYYGNQIEICDYNDNEKKLIFKTINLDNGEIFNNKWIIDKENHNICHQSMEFIDSDGEILEFISKFKRYKDINNNKINI